MPDLPIVPQTRTPAQSSPGSAIRPGEARPPRVRHVPLRAMVLSLLLAPACCYWAQSQPVDRIFSLMVPPVALTLAMVIINIPLRLWLPRLALTETELVVFYGMQAVMCAMASEWIDNIHPYIYSYGAFVHPDVQHDVLPYLSSWLFFKNGQGLQDFVVGGKTFGYFWAHLGMWWPKIIAWTVIVSLLCLAMLCINALMADQWTYREKLSFPLAQLPLAMTQGGGSSPFWKDRLMWGAFAVMFGIDMLNGFAFLYPALPRINVRFLTDILKWLPSPPWNQIGWTPVGIFPFLAAIGIFMPVDLLFSLLFFFFVRKIQQVIAADFGNAQGVFGGGGLVPSAPYFSEQSWGAFLGMFAGALWTARPYLREVWQKVKQGGTVDSGRISPRMGLAGLVLSLAALGLIGVGIGLSFVYVVLYMLLFLAFSTALTRLRAQLGAPTHEMAFMGPNQLFVDFHGTEGVDTETITRTVTAFFFMNRIHRTDPMPSQLEAVYLGERSQASQRGMFLALLIATIAGSILGLLVRTYLDYRDTPGDTSPDATGVVTTLLDTRSGPNFSAILAVIAGFAVVLLLDFVRFRVIGFPLHPAGYALAMNFGVDYYWFGLLIALIAKASVLRYSGLGGFQKLRMVAFGIMLGEFAAEAIWAVYSMLHHDQATYTISINGKFGWNQ